MARLVLSLMSPSSCQFSQKHHLPLPTYFVHNFHFLLYCAVDVRQGLRKPCMQSCDILGRKTHPPFSCAWCILQTSSLPIYIGFFLQVPPCELQQIPIMAAAQPVPCVLPDQAEFDQMSLTEIGERFKNDRMVPAVWAPRKRHDLPQLQSSVGTAEERCYQQAHLAIARTTTAAN